MGECSLFATASLPLVEIINQPQSQQQSSTNVDCVSSRVCNISMDPLWEPFSGSRAILLPTLKIATEYAAVSSTAIVSSPHSSTLPGGSQKLPWTSVDLRCNTQAQTACCTYYCTDCCFVVFQADGSMGEVKFVFRMAHHLKSVLASQTPKSHVGC